jgi:transcriptional regulator GlxA family with amidase domain
VESLPPGSTGWRAALNDRHVGAALALMHSRPGENWTVEKLARQVNLSRSTLGEHFSAILGEPVMAFLARVRVQRAAHELLTGGKAIKTVAQEAGYESPTSFARAFRRAYRVAPSQWAKRQRNKRPG